MSRINQQQQERQRGGGSGGGGNRPPGHTPEQRALVSMIAKFDLAKPMSRPDWGALTQLAGEVGWKTQDHSAPADAQHFNPGKRHPQGIPHGHINNQSGQHISLGGGKDHIPLSPAFSYPYKS